VEQGDGKPRIVAMWGVVSAGQMYCFGDMVVVVEACGRAGIIVGKKETGRQ
jgi:hypothetical protein